MPDLLPKALVADMVEKRFAEFTAQFGTSMLLLVSVNNPSSPLIPPLEKVVRAQPRRKRAPMDILTTTEIPLMDSSARNDLTGPGRVELLARLDSSYWFVLPLVKRQATGDESILTLGRADDCDIILKHASVSAHHAQIRSHEDGSLEVRDLQSTNGTVVNGRKLPPNGVHWLQPMDHLQLGSVATFTCLPNVLRSVLKAAATATA